jgi:DeoR family fructose operon transcriptional repressor
MPAEGTPEVREMIPAERRARIVELLQERRAVRVSVLSDVLGVSEMTIRRDLERLEQEGLLSRMHGGAILKRRLIEEPLYVTNVRTHSEEKRRIAQAAAAMIKPGETVFLSSGTTATQVLSHVDPQIKARIVTHNLGAVSSAQRTSLDVVLLGGLYRPRSNTLQGPLAIEAAGQFHASLFIFGADALSLDEGMTTPSLGLAGVERTMIRQTRGEIVVLADSSKFGVVGDVVICTLDKVDAVIVDDGVDEDVREEIVRIGPRCIVV